MKNFIGNKYILVFGFIALLSFFSCRKKDKRYEGTYVGVERYTFRDSGETVNSIDSTYYQEIIITYDGALLPKKMHYDCYKLTDPLSPWTMTQKSIVDGEYQTWNSPNIFKFSGDSLYMYATNFSDQVENWDFASWEFKGKRN